MTLSQAFTHKTGADESVAAAELTFAGLNPSRVWATDDKALKCSFYRALIGYIGRDNVGVKQITEGGYTIIYDKTEKANFMKGLALESGCSELIEQYANDTVQNMSHLW